MIETARLISFISADAATNMAIDEAILECQLEGRVPATLRLYRFSPPAVSLGYSQRLSASTLENISARGIEIVRRPTGGRAVLHECDLTYSFVAASRGGHASGENALLVEGVLGAYRQICQALILAFEELGLKLQIGRSQPSSRDQIDCFEATTVADLHYQGQKLIGSAQMRRRQAVLQHGSIVLNQPQSTMHDLLKGAGLISESARPDVTHHANLHEIMGREVSFEEIQNAMRSGFEKAFSIRFIPSPLTEREKKLTQELKAKYLQINSANMASAKTSGDSTLEHV